jgi:hypothetical protein
LRTRRICPLSGRSGHAPWCGSDRLGRGSPNSDSASFAVSDRTIVVLRATATRAIRSVTPSVAGTGRYGAASAGYRTSIGGIERFPDGIRDRAGANNRRLGHD